MKRVFSILVALVLCISLFAACGDKTESLTSEEGKALNEAVIGKSGDIEISQAYYNLFYELMYSQMSQYGQMMGEDWLSQEAEEGKTFGDIIKEGTKSQLGQSVVICNLAEKYGIEVDKDVKEQVEASRTQLIESYGGEDAYKEFLTSSKTTDEAMREYLETSVLYSLVYEKITAKGEEGYIADEEIEKEFLSGRNKVQHILISTTEQTDSETGETKPARSDEEAQKIVSEVLAKIEKGEDFDKLIDEYDEDPGMESGKFYVFGEGEMVAEFEQASKDLKVGEYTKEAVKTSYGYHIIKKYELTADDEEFDTFKEEKQQTKVNDALVKKAEELTIKWEDKKIDEYIKKWDEERAAQAAEQQEAAPTQPSVETTEPSAETEAPADGETAPEAESETQTETATEKTE